MMLEDNNVEITEHVNDDVLKILPESVDVISMEEKYRAAGIEMKNTKLLSRLLHWMSKLQTK